MSTEHPVVPGPDGNYASQLADYRAQLVQLRQEAERSFDHTVLTLSGGALGISFAFVRDFIQGQALSTGFLIAAWIAWVSSLALTLASHYVSALAMARAVKQVDDGSIETQLPGGAYAGTTKFLNAAGGLCFVGGVLLMALFVARNLG